MGKRFYIGTDKEEFEKVLDEHTDQSIERDKTKKILERYSTKYEIKEEVVNVKGQQVHIDYLPTIRCHVGSR